VIAGGHTRELAGWRYEEGRWQPVEEHFIGPEVSVCCVREPSGPLCCADGSMARVHLKPTAGLVVERNGPAAQAWAAWALCHQVRLGGLVVVMFAKSRMAADKAPASDTRPKYSFATPLRVSRRASLDHGICIGFERVENIRLDRPRGQRQAAPLTHDTHCES